MSRSADNAAPAAPDARPRLLLMAIGNGLATTITGGSVCFLEFLRALHKDGGFRMDVATTPGGKEMIQGYFRTTPEVLSGVRFIDVRASLLLRREPFLMFRAWSYLISTAQLLLQARRFKGYDVGITLSDFFFDLAPLVRMRRLGGVGRLFASSYHRYPPPGRRQGVYAVNWTLHRLQKLSFSLIARHADQYFINNSDEGRELAREVAAMGYPREPHFLDLGLHLDAIAAAPRSPRVFTAVHIGMRPSKGIFDLPEIWEAVRASRPDATLMMVGTAPNDLRRKIEAQFAARGLASSVSFSGFITDEEKFGLIKSAEIFVAPSHEEGWGIAVGEAMACGVPVVGYELHAYLSVYGPEAMAYAPAFDKAAFARQAVRLLADPSARAAQAEAGRKSAVRYGWDKVFDIEISLLREACAGARRP